MYFLFTNKVEDYRGDNFLCIFKVEENIKDTIGCNAGGGYSGRYLWLLQLQL
jgi:hypothetical protein